MSPAEALNERKLVYELTVVKSGRVVQTVFSRFPGNYGTEHSSNCFSRESISAPKQRAKEL